MISTATIYTSLFRKFVFSLFSFLFLSANSFSQGSVSATYSVADIPTNYNSFDANCNGPITTLSVNLPAGDSYTVTGVDIAYAMTADNSGWISDQRSQLHCQNTSTTETSVFSGVGNFEGSYSYNRSNVSIANDVYAGGTELIFEIRAWRIFGSTPTCGTQFNKVDNGTWTVTVHHSAEVNIPKIGVNTNNPTQVLDVVGKMKIGDDASSPTAGTMRFNNGNFEGWNGSEWVGFNSFENDLQGTILFSELGTDQNLISLGYELAGKTELYNSQTYVGEHIGTYTQVSVPSNVIQRYGHTAVWTGTEMLIWGGTQSNLGDPAPGFVGFREITTYNPSTNTWSVLPLGVGAPPLTRRGHSAIWTGTHMIIWGGRSNQPSTNTNTIYSDGYIYHRASNTWAPLPQNGAIPSARMLHDAIYTGNEMIIYGGGSAIGGRYNLTTGYWINLTVGPSAMTDVACTWTGTDMIVLGRGGNTLGGSYNLASNSWTFPLPSNGPHDINVQGGDAAWTGSEVIVWGGIASGGRYNPSTEDFPYISNEGPQHTTECSVIWTGSEMIIFGGSFNDKPWVTGINSNQCYRFGLTGSGSTYTPGAFNEVFFYKKS